ncbi:uncharacterized protein LOC131437377 [Malaya genurostris]|uniref:uncharacterized protein LOC131437377 n=1 Tax=Malaya genurostris TaxID=325434 RepID=UPI0026F3FB72|nr:uncharacterized protein LOC131437377 [Malaya genurostris]
MIRIDHMSQSSIDELTKFPFTMLLHLEAIILKCHELADHQFVKQNIYRMVLEVDWSVLIGAEFLLCFLSKADLVQSNIWFIMLVRYLEMEYTEEHIDEESLKGASYVSDLCTFLDVCYLKQYQVPVFLVKYVLEGIARFQNHPLFKTNQTIHSKQLRLLMPPKDPETIYGLLPASIPRLKWFQQSHLPWKAQFLYRQRLEALQERLFPMHTVNEALLSTFPIEMLFSVLCSKNSNPIGQTNASIILSRVVLSEPLLQTLIDKKLAKKRDQNWYQYLRAMYSSLGELSEKSRFQLISFISNILKPSELDTASSVLVIDSLTQLFTTNQQTDGDITEGTKFG